MQKTLELWTRKAVKCCTQNLTDHLSIKEKDSSAESNVDHEDQTQGDFRVEQWYWDRLFL